MKGIVLVGFMGTGKNAVGRVLAQGLGWAMVDTDDMIVMAAGKSVTKIFAEDGEAVFRQWEAKILDHLVAALHEPRIVAAGGGIVLDPQNWPKLRALGHVVCLTAAPAEILRRVGEGRDRPLLAGPRAQVLTRIQDLLAERRTAYAQADWTVATDHQTPQQIADTITNYFPDLEAG